MAQQEQEGSFFGNIVSGERFVPRIPSDDEEASQMASEIRNILEEAPENVLPQDIYSMTLALNQYTFSIYIEEPFREDIASELLYNFTIGLQALMRSRHYNLREHDGLRHDLFEGYLNQINLQLSLTPDAPNKPTP